MQSQTKKPSAAARHDTNTANVTAAVGMQTSAGRSRARRNTLFTQSVIWVTGLICTAFLLGALAQAWSNNQLAQKVQAAQQQLQQVQAHHNALQKQADEYSKPGVIESEARQLLGYVRPGEHAVVIVNATPQPATASPATTTKSTTQDFWREWWHAFFGN